MVALKFVCELQQKCGLINLYNYPKPWQRRLQSGYCTFQICFLVVNIGVHTFSTVTRSIRYEAELFQMLLEDVYMYITVMGAIHFCLHHREINQLLHTVSNSFCKPDKHIHKRLVRRTGFIFFSMVIMAVFACSASFLEVLVPLSAEELAIRRHVYYNVKHPERRLPWTVRWPFVDESEGLVYAFLLILQCYIAAVYIVMNSVYISLTPIYIYNQMAQCETLAKYITLLGKDTRTNDNSRIFYTNIEKSEFIVRASQSKRKMQLESCMEKMRIKEQYEQRLVKQIVKYHHKIQTFQCLVTKLTSPLMQWLVIANWLLVSLCLYQLCLNYGHMSNVRYFKFLAVFCAVLVEYFICCNSSEMADDCHRVLRSAVLESHWHRCSPQTRRDICILLKRIQRNNHIKYCNGVFTVSLRTFVTAVNMGYNFVNFMKLREGNMKYEMSTSAH